MTLLLLDVPLCNLLITATWRETTDHTHTHTRAHTPVYKELHMNRNSTSTFLNCFYSIKDWMAEICLQLHTDKTEDVISVPDSFVLTVMEILGSLPSSVKPNFCSLGVYGQGLES